MAFLTHSTRTIIIFIAPPSDRYHKFSNDCLWQNCLFDGKKNVVVTCLVLTWPTAARRSTPPTEDGAKSTSRFCPSGTSIRSLRSCLAGESDSAGGHAETSKCLSQVRRWTELVLGYEARGGALGKKNRKINRHLVPIESFFHVRASSDEWLVRLDAKIFMNVRNDRVWCCGSFCKKKSEHFASTSVEDAD